MYRLDPKAAPYAFKPYDRQRVRRYLHDARVVSEKMSAWARRVKRARVADVERQIAEACS